MKFSNIILILILFPLLAQGQYYTPEEIEVEKLLIDASRESLLKNYEKSIAILKEAQKLDGNNAAVAFQLGRLYNSRGDVEKAIKNMKIAVEFEGNNEWYYKELLEIYRHTGRYKDALELCEKLVAVKPDDKINYYDWAWYYAVQNKFSKAIKVYDKAEKKFGYDGGIAQKRHRLYLVMGDKKKAANEYLNLTKAFPENIEYHFLLADFYEQHEERNKAENVYRDILKIDPENGEATLALASKSNKNKGDFAYLEALTPVFEKQDIEIDLKMGKLFPIIQKIANTGDVALADEALALSEILEKVHPEEAKAYAASGDILYHSNRLEPALVKYKNSLTLAESNFLIWENLLYIHLELKQYSELLKQSEEAMDIFPNKAVLYYLNGNASAQLGKKEDAFDALNQALLMSGKDIILKYKIYKLEGEIYCKAGQGEKAIKSFAKALELNSKEKLNCNGDK